MARAASTTRRAAVKPAPAPEPVEDEFEDLEETEDSDEVTEDDDDDLEELDESDEDADNEPDPKAKKPTKRTPPVRPKIAFGSPELAAHVTEVTGETFDARGIRMLLRKLAKDGKLNRVIGEERARYEFSGPTDPTVKLVVAMVKSGEAKALKQEGLQAVKDNAAAKKTAKAAAAAKTAEPEDDDMEEIEDEAPAPKPRRRAAASTAKPAPAKATPTTRRRAPAAK